MNAMSVQSYACGCWVPPGPGARELTDAATGEVFARAGDGALDPGEMLAYARGVGGPALRAGGFHDRAHIIRALAIYLGERKDELYELSYRTGATTKDHLFDIDGGIGTMRVMSSKARREMPDGPVFRDGAVEQLSRTGSFVGQHIATPLRGAAVLINAFNFPVWGMLEKLAPAFLAGMPVIVKPATDSCHVTEHCVRMMLDSGLLPAGALQLVTGGLGNMLDLLGPQDLVSFTGSAETGTLLRSTPNLLSNSVRFVAEQDSLNATILAPDIQPGTPSFGAFIKEIRRELTVKAGQKCTAIRRIFVPESHVDAVITALQEALGSVRVGDPRAPDTQMGALVSKAQRRDVVAKAALIGQEAEQVLGDADALAGQPGAFLPPMLFHCTDPDAARHVHAAEAFGPVATVLGTRDIAHAAGLANRGGGALVLSCVTEDPETARALVWETAPHHGRVYFTNAAAMGEATGHGAPMPHMIHGGPGRAGGGEELGGVRAILHHMQRTAVQGPPDLLSAVTGAFVPGSTPAKPPAHPFTRPFEDLVVGETLLTPSRTVTLEDIEHFAEFTGDAFYAHMDAAAAARNPFFPGRVAHGYLLLSFAAGLFVDPAEGPVLANTGLDSLRFLKPVSPGTAIHVALTVKSKTRRTEDYGEVRWQVAIRDDAGDPVAEYELLTMNARHAGGAVQGP